MSEGGVDNPISRFSYAFSQDLWGHNFGRLGLSQSDSFSSSKHQEKNRPLSPTDSPHNLALAGHRFIISGRGQRPHDDSFEENGRTFFRNAGKSRRYGVELGLGAQIFEGLRASFAYTYLNAEFDEFLKDGVDLEGNEVPGLPQHQVHGELFYQHVLGFYGALDIQYVSDFYVTDENTEQNDSYTIANLRLGYEHLWENWLIAPFFGVQNLFDENYNSNVRINAFGGRFFEPGPELNLYGGFTVAYNW